MPKVSVIVPVYNVSKYLEKCLISLVNQTLLDIEIVVVNDGSKDDSDKIISKYEKEYPTKIKSYKKENGGLSDARNYGIKHANGEYIGFVDGDDFVDIRMFKEMYDEAIKKSYDIVVCDLFYVYDYDCIPHDSAIKKETTDIKSVMLNIYPTAWNKIYKREFLNSHDLLFKKNVWYEDVEFIYRVLPYVKSIGCVKKPFYQYVQRSGAISKTYDERLYNYIDNWNGLVTYYKENKLYNKFYFELEYCYIRYIYGTFLKQAMNFENPKDFKKALNTAYSEVKKHFPKYRKNKLFYKSFKGLFFILFNKSLIYLGYLVRRLVK